MRPLLFLIYTNTICHSSDLISFILLVHDTNLYGGPQVHSEFQTTLPILNLTPNSLTSLQILKSHSEFSNLTPNSKTSLEILKPHSEFLNLTVPIACILLSVCSLHFTLTLHFTPGPQSSVRSPQSSFYTDRYKNWE